MHECDFLRVTVSLSSASLHERDLLRVVALSSASLWLNAVRAKHAPAYNPVSNVMIGDRIGPYTVTAKLGVARPAQVCEYLEMDTSTLSRTVDRMVANGWLEIVPDEDGRSQPFRLTAEGRRLLERALPAWEQAQAEARKLLGDDGLRLLDAAIGRVKSAHAGA